MGGTREARTATLEAARVAVDSLGDAIDQGIVLAKQTWDPSRSEERTNEPAKREDE